MVIHLIIEKESAEECPYNCPFSKDGRNDIDECILFNSYIEYEGYYDSKTRIACSMCQIMFNYYNRKVANGVLEEKESR